VANQTLVIIPTYNEVENLPLIVERVLATKDAVDILVVDDNSPDGTGAKADELAAAHDEVNVLHRTGKDGLLAAYRAGFNWGLERDYQVLVQMDADGSHAPEELHRLLDALDNGADLAIGSRYIEGGEVVNWPKNRFLLSKLGNQYVSLALGTDVADMTAGYRAFKREVLEEVDLDSLSTKGYIFQVEIAHKVDKLGFDIREVPITFEDRKLGESKLDASFATASLAEVTKWGVSEKATFVKGLTSETVRQLVYAVEHSKLSDVRRTAADAPEQIVNALGEFGAVAKHEIDNANLGKLQSNAARRVNTAIHLGEETVRQALYALGFDGKRKH